MGSINTEPSDSGRVRLDAESPRVIDPPIPKAPPPMLNLLPLRDPDTLGTLIEIRQAEGKGYGIFALEDILPGTVLLSEAPLVTLLDMGTRADPLDAEIEALTPERKASYLSLHSFSSNPAESINRSIMYSNGYAIMNDLATGIFETASRINHSCVPNSFYGWKSDLGRMEFTNRFKLLDGEEVTVDYGHNRKNLLRIYGFDCMCGGCTDSGSPLQSSKRSDETAQDDVPKIDSVAKAGLETDGKEA